MAIEKTPSLGQKDCAVDITFLMTWKGTFRADLTSRKVISHAERVSPCHSYGSDLGVLLTDLGLAPHDCGKFFKLRTPYQYQYLQNFEAGTGTQTPGFRTQYLYRNII